MYSIIQDPSHGEQDPQESRPIIRKRQINRNDQSDDHIQNRLRYLGDLEQLHSQEALVICTDERGYPFGRSPNQRVSRPRGMPSYGSIKPTRFEIKQWAAACGDDCSITRPWHGWIKKKAGITP